jgi:hypothetical protein
MTGTLVKKRKNPVHGLSHDKGASGRDRRENFRFLTSVPTFSALLLLLLASAAAAHNLAPAYLALSERAGGRVAVEWKLPAAVPRGAWLEPRLPCPDANERSARADGDAVVVSWEIACGGSLVGRAIAVDGLAGSGSDALVRVALADGREIRAILTAGAPALTLPARESRASVFASYAKLGAQHLATGLDHVLFVAGLALLLGATRRLALAVSAFTAGHSVTLALAALGFVALPRRALEVAIAASIVVLALQLARKSEAAEARGVARWPALLPFAFGLLHGLGFAGALGELGLPQQAIPLALFAFNVGIELGQLGLVALLIASLWALARAPFARSSVPGGAAARALAELPATAIGGLGVFWCLERALGGLFP